jgi:hypothetical protein
LRLFTSHEIGGLGSSAASEDDHGMS